jgi:hypothetical protein
VTLPASRMNAPGVLSNGYSSEGLSRPLMGAVSPAPAASLAQALALAFALQGAFGSKVRRARIHLD